MKTEEVRSIRRKFFSGPTLMCCVYCGAACCTYYSLYTFASFPFFALRRKTNLYEFNVVVTVVTDTDIFCVYVCVWLFFSFCSFFPCQLFCTLVPKIINIYYLENVKMVLMSSV